MTHYRILRDTVMNVSTGRTALEAVVSLYIRNNLNYRIRNDLSVELINIDIIFIEIPKTNLNTNTNTLIGYLLWSPTCLGY